MTTKKKDEEDLQGTFKVGPFVVGNPAGDKPCCEHHNDPSSCSQCKKKG